MKKINASLMFLDLLNLCSIKDSDVQSYNPNENGATCYTYVKIIVLSYIDRNSLLCDCITNFTYMTS